MGWKEEIEKAQEANRHKARVNQIDKRREKVGLAETVRRMKLEGEWLELATRHQEIDDQWYAAKPSSQSRKMHSGERRMLYGILDYEERVESMVGGTFRQDTNRLHKHNGVAVATNRRVIFLDHGILGSTEVMEIAYVGIESITYSTGLMFAGVQVVGRGASGYRIEDIMDKKSVQPFVACVRHHMEDAYPASSPTVPSALDEIERLASLVERGFLDRAEFDAKKKELLG